MGKKRITNVSQQPEENKKQASLKEDKVHLANLGGGQRIKAVDAGPIIEENELINTSETKKEVKAKKRNVKTRVRGKKYQNLKKMVDPQINYSLSEGIKLLKNTAKTKFVGSAEAHFLLTKAGLKGEVELPHFSVKAKKVEIADENTIKKLEEGKIDFEILLANPKMMPQLAKYARLLGPKGLMPNPKNGTISENPQNLVKEFENPKFAFKTESQAPIIHLVFGKTNQPEKELEANFLALVKVINKNNILKTTIKSSMGPSIKIKL